MNICLFGRQFTLSKSILAIAIVLLLVILGIVGYLLSGKFQPFDEISQSDEMSKSTEIILNDTTSSNTNEQAMASITEVVEQIKVYVTGCVNKPGVVVLKKGQIIEDAIIAAGGFTQEADKNNINLAFVLNENVMLRIKPISEQNNMGAQSNNTQRANNPQPNGTQQANKVTQSNNNQPNKVSQNDTPKTNNTQQTSKTEQGGTDKKYIENSGVDIITESINTVIGEQDNNDDKASKININKADTKQLDTLPGIGEATAAAIIEYREKNGPFKKNEDIMKVAGIKQKSFEKIKDMICIE